MLIRGNYFRLLAICSILIGVLRLSRASSIPESNYETKLTIKPTFGLKGSLLLDCTLDLTWMDVSPFTIPGWSAPNKPLFLESKIEVTGPDGQKKPILGALLALNLGLPNIKIVLHKNETKTFALGSFDVKANKLCGRYTIAGTLVDGGSNGRPFTINLGNTIIEITKNDIDPYAPLVHLTELDSPLKTFPISRMQIYFAYKNRIPARGWAVISVSIQKDGTVSNPTIVEASDLDTGRAFLDASTMLLFFRPTSHGSPVTVNASIMFPAVFTGTDYIRSP
jgi:hypothetical protein